MLGIPTRCLMLNILQITTCQQSLNGRVGDRPACVPACLPAPKALMLHSSRDSELDGWLAD